MMNISEELRQQIGQYKRAALSYTGVDGYPVTLPLPFSFDGEQATFTLPMPKQHPAFSPNGQVSLTLLVYDQQVANERFLLFYGQLSQGPGVLTFSPSQVIVPSWRPSNE